jgi:GH24 family phage-related lysozyme (muramidase)
MKFSYNLMPLFALGAAAAPAGTLEARNTSPISSATVALIERLEGWSATFYTIDGHATIGKHTLLINKSKLTEPQGMVMIAWNVDAAASTPL